MTKGRIILFSAILLLFFTDDACGQEATPLHKDSLKNVIHRYYELSLKIYQSNSVAKDIDDLFELFTEDFVYVHPKYGGAYTRKDLYDGYVRNQKNGAYDGSIADLSLKNMIIGLNAVVTERAYLKKEDSGEFTEVDPGMTLFEFKDGKISKIFEYW